MAEEFKPDKDSEVSDEQLAENISRVMADAQMPKLDEKKAAQILAELKTRQTELFQNGNKDMATTATQYTDAWQGKRESRLSDAWVFVLPALLLLIVFLGGLLYWTLNSEEPNQNERVVQVEEKDEKSKPRFAQDLGKFVEGKLTRRDLADGTVLIANALANYSIDGPRSITLNAGELFLIVNKSDEPFIVNTSEGEVRATGTRFSVSANQKKKITSAAVAQGVVELDGDAGEIRLTAGQRGSLERKKKPTREAAPRLSHLVSWAKEALSQEELLVEPNEKENGLIAIDPSGQESQLSLRKYHVNIYIEDGIARTTIDQTFFNHNPWNTEGTFYFPLPPDASVSRLAMYVAGNLNEGGMVTRKRGQQIYEEIRLQRRDPALLEMMEGNMFKMRIFPLEGRQEKRIFLSYTQKLSELYGTMRYWFPMDHTHSVAGEVSISVRVKDGAKNFVPQSSTHDVKVAKDGDDLVLDYAQKKIKPDQDFLLHLVPERKLEPTRIATCEKDGKKFLFARIHPELEGEFSSEPRQWIVLNDISASRSKINSEAQRYILSRLIEGADDDDSIHLIDLNTRAIPVSVKPLNVRSREAEKLAGHRVEHKLGACNIQAGINAVKKAIADHDLKNPHLVYLGDGVATDGERELSQLSGMLSRDVPFIGIGVGKSVDALFMQTAADMTGGMFATMNPDEDIDWRVFDLIAALNTPRMNKVEVLLFDENDKPVDAIAYPSSRGLADGETLTVVARCDGELPAELVFRGEVNGKTMALSTDLTNAKESTEFIPRLWAKRHIDELLKSDMPREEEITELSKEYYVVTPYTSLIVLEDDAMYEEYNVERGRKDHWALYDAPKKIEVVREDVDWSRWGWYRMGNEDSAIATKAKPKTVQEIVDNMQLRINAPFYYYAPREPGSSRTGLYLLADSLLEGIDEAMLDEMTEAEKEEFSANEARSSKLLAFWYLISAGRQDILRDAKSISNETSDSTESKQDKSRSAFAAKKKRIRMPMMMQGRGIFGRYRTMPQFMFGVERGGQNEFGLVMAGERFQPISFYDQLLPGQQTMLGSSGTERRMLPGQRYENYWSNGRVRPQVHFSFQHAMQTRWERISRDVENYNRQYGQWNDRWSQWNTWDVNGNGIDLRNATRTYWNGGLRELVSDMDGIVPLDASFESDGWMTERYLSENLSPSLEYFYRMEGLTRDEAWMDSPDSGLVPVERLYSLDFAKTPTWHYLSGYDSRFLQIDGTEISARVRRLLIAPDNLTRFEELSGTRAGTFGNEKNLLEIPRLTGVEDVRLSTRIDERQIMSDFRFSERNLKKLRMNFMAIRPLATYSTLARSRINQPPMVSSIAADVLRKRRDELVKTELDESGRRELELLNAAMDNVEAAAARIENSSDFWNGGWGYQPRVENFQPPVIQAWAGYSWAFDLTRYAKGLYTNSNDILGEVEKEYGTEKPWGTVDKESLEQIKRARAAIAPVRISTAEPSGDQESDGADATEKASQVELLVASGDRYAVTTQGDMYLTERLICDGENIWQIYDELGLASRREATALRLAQLRNMVPHLLPPPEVLAMFHNIELIEQDDHSFTLKLTMASQPESESASAASDEKSDLESNNADDDSTSEADSTEEDSAGEEDDIVIIIRVDRTGRILEKTMQINAEDFFKVTFDYKSRQDHVAIRWQAMLPPDSEDDNSDEQSTASDKQSNSDSDEELLKEWKTVGSTSYAARSGMLLESAFNVKQDADKLVVIDMPLRRPQWYYDQITQLRTETVTKEKEDGTKVEEKVARSLTDEDRVKLIDLYRHHALSSIQELNWRRWNQECGPAKSSMLAALNLQDEMKVRTRPGDVTLLGSAGTYGIRDLLKEYLVHDQVERSTKNLTELNRENLLVRFFSNSRNVGWQLDEKAFNKENGLLGHLAAYLKSNNWSNRENLYTDFEKRFGSSPLLLALTSRHAQQIGNIGPWIRLNKNPRWQGVALLMASPNTGEPHFSQFADAYWEWREELRESKWIDAGIDVPVNAQISTILQTASADKFNEMIDERFDRAKKAGSITALILFGEHAANWGLPETASAAMKLAEEKAIDQSKDRKLALSVRQALAEGYWTCNLPKPSLEHFQVLLDQLDANGISASPALLASAARVASLAGNNAKAIEFEERALAVEHKYLPDMINLNSFNQRYDWLWKQYVETVSTAAKNGDEQELKQVSARAKSAWVRWQEVDKDNLSQASNIATLLKTAGADDEEIWQHLSTAIDRKPRDSASYTIVANWYQSQKKLSKAEQLLEEAYRWDTANPQLLYQRAEILETLKRGSEAAVLYRKIAEGEWPPAREGWKAKAAEKLKGIEEL